MVTTTREATSEVIPEVIFDSNTMEYAGAVKKRGLPRWYFPLIIVILLTEAAVLVLVLTDTIPILHSFKVYPFAQYAPYINASETAKLSVLITRWFFFLLTAGVLLPTTLIIALEITRRFIICRRGESHAWDEEFTWLNKLDRTPVLPGESKNRVQGDYITRFDIHQRIQHYLLMSSFIVLAVTGVLRGFPSWPTFQWFTNLFGGVEILRLVHDAAAFTMILDCIYHVAYIGYGYFVKGRFPSAMIPRWKDLKDIVRTLLWIFGLRKHEPEYDHFQYGQKIDYWAIFWGMPVMVITGMIMMFPAFFSQWLGGQWFGVVAVAHRDEAVLAIGFIAIVHMYYGHLQTAAFPVNTAMFTGKMHKTRYKQWFGREYAQITGEKSEE